MGIFNKRQSELDRLQEAIIKNPTHPFRPLGEGQLFLSVTPRAFFVAVAAVVLALGIGTACLALGAEGELYYIIPVAMLTAGVYGLVQFKDTREYVIDLDAARYAFFLRFMGWRTLVHAGALHNAYIRLVKRVASGGQPYYYLTFNGFRMEKHNLTSAVRDKATLRDLGRQIASGCGLNYFDTNNVSLQHVVRHRPPETARFTGFEDH